MCNKILFPDYDHSILGIPNSILKHYGISNDYPTLPVLDKALAKNYKNVVLLILDGLGTDMLNHNMHVFSFLRRNIKDKITSVFPPTTTSATTTYYSSLPPISHGWIGWSPYFKEHNRVIELFRNKDLYTQKNLDIEPVSNMLHYEHITTQITQINKDVTTTKVFPAFMPNGAKNFAELCQKIQAQTNQQGNQFILAYWNDPDHTSHEFGPYSKEVKLTIKNINQHIKNMCQNLKDTLVIISADHGQIEVSDIVYIDEYDGVVDCLQAPLSIDERVSAIFLKEGAEQKFKQLFEQYFSKDFILIKSDDALAQNLFGKGVIHPKVKDFLGDYLIISTSTKSLRQRLPNSAPEPKLKGAHSGLLKKEMLVPLILIKR